MATVRTKKTVKTEETQANHFLNVYLGKKQIGYLVIDKFGELIDKCVDDEEFATRFIKSCTAVYRERGESTGLDLTNI